VPPKKRRLETTGEPLDLNDIAKASRVCDQMNEQRISEQAQ